MKKIFSIGCVTTDIIVSPVDHIPTPGTLQTVRSTSTHVGGCASNAAIDLAKLGVPVALACQVGNDAFGDFVISQAAAVGVDVSRVVRGEAQTTSSVVCVNSDGERSFLYLPGSTAAFTADALPDPIPDNVDIVFVAGAMLLHSFDGEPCARYLEQARRQGKYTVMDTAWDSEGVWMPRIAAALPGLDLFMPSLKEAEKLSGKTDPADIADVFFDMGVKSVIVKLGDRGAYFCPTPRERFTLPAFTNVKAVDTTGAGDSFCAGFLCGLAQGWDFRKSGEFANAVGAMCVGEIGASTGIRSIPEVLRFIETHR